MRVGWRDVFNGGLVQRVANAVRRYHHRREDPYAGNVPAPLGDAELRARAAAYRYRHMF